MTYKQIAKKYNIHRTTVARLGRRGLFTTEKIGREFVVTTPPDQIASIIAQHVAARHGWKKRSTPKRAPRRARATKTPSRLGAALALLTMPPKTRKVLMQIANRFSYEELTILAQL